MTTPWERVMEKSRLEREQWKRDENLARATQQYALLACSARRYQLIKYTGVSRQGAYIIQNWQFATAPLPYAEAMAELKRLNGEFKSAQQEEAP